MCAVARGKGEDALGPQVLALVGDLADAGGFGVDAGFPVHAKRVVGPGRFPQTQADLQVVVGLEVALVVRDHRLAEERGRRRLAAAADDVPADASLREVVEGREAAGESGGLLVRRAVGQHDAQLGGGRGDCRHDGDRVRHGHVVPGFDGEGDELAVEGGVAVGVGEEEEVEPSRLQLLGEFGPVLDRQIVGLGVRGSRQLEPITPLGLSAWKDAKISGLMCVSLWVVQRCR